MRPILTAALLSVFLVAGASAQRGDGWGRDRDGRYDDRWSRGSRGAYGGSIVDRVLSDLSRAQSYGRVDGHERKHFDNARRDLVRFQQNWSRGRFDRDRLDGAIGNIADLAQSDQVHPREREMLYRDLSALRDFRASRGYSGGR